LDESFELKPIKREVKNPKQHFKSIPMTRTYIQIAYQFITAPTFPNPYVSHTINNINLIITLNNDRKDWIKKYYKIIERIEIIADIQCQLQNIIILADVANTQLAEIETTILQASDVYRTQIASDIFSISEDLQDIIQGNMKNQVYHIQSLLANELDRYKGKGNSYTDNYIKEIQDVYKIKQPDQE